jgi:hypothetical protein
MQSNFHEALRNPRQVYGRPDAVLEDNSLSSDQKRQILKSWEADAIRLQDSEAEGFAGGERGHLDEVKRALDSL